MIEMPWVDYSISKMDFLAKIMKEVIGNSVNNKEIMARY